MFQKSHVAAYVLRLKLGHDSSRTDPGQFHGSIAPTDYIDCINVSTFANDFIPQPEGQPFSFAGNKNPIVVRQVPQPVSRHVVSATPVIPFLRAWSSFETSVNKPSRNAAWLLFALPWGLLSLSPREASCLTRIERTAFARTLLPPLELAFELHHRACSRTYRALWY